MRVLELAGIGPGPFCAMLLADMGADVLRLDRIEPADLGLPLEPRYDILSRGRRSIAIDLKRAGAIEIVLSLAEKADVLLEGFRPGVAERLGLSPEACFARNPRLVYGRVTGWGQHGPLAHAPGHDINYIALAGVLDCVGRAGEPPVPPLNLVGDYGGGGMLLAVGVLAGIIHARAGGPGQVVDAAMVDGAALLTTFVHGLRAMGRWPGERGGTCSTRVRGGTRCTRRRTASTSHSVRSNRSSTQRWSSSRG